MSNDNRRWLPYNLDGTAHECRHSTTKQQQVKRESPRVDDIIQKSDKNKLTLEEIDKRLKRIEYTLYGET